MNKKILTLIVALCFLTGCKKTWTWGGKTTNDNVVLDGDNICDDNSCEKK